MLYSWLGSFILYNVILYQYNVVLSVGLVSCGAILYLLLSNTILYSRSGKTIMPAMEFRPAGC